MIGEHLFAAAAASLIFKPCKLCQFKKRHPQGRQAAAASDRGGTRVGLHLTALLYIQHDRKVAPDHKILSFNLYQNMQMTASNTPHSHFRPPLHPQEGETNPELKYKAAKLYTCCGSRRDMCIVISHPYSVQEHQTYV